MKAFRLLLLLGAIQLLAMPAAEARPAYCEDALTRCLNKCNSFPEIFKEGCMIGCGIGYLTCGD